MEAERRLGDEEWRRVVDKKGHAVGGDIGGDLVVPVAFFNQLWTRSCWMQTWSSERHHQGTIPATSC